MKKKIVSRVHRPMFQVAVLGGICILSRFDGFVLADEEPGERFQPPALAKLDASVEWVEQPVLNGRELLKQYWQNQPAVEVTIEDALELSNDSERANGQILDALGRPPANADEVDWNASIIRHATRDVNSFNPLMLSSMTDFDVHFLLGFGLFGFDWNLRPFASQDAVKSWHTSADRLYDKVILRDDLTWSDGQPVTAHDVVFSFQTIMNPNVPVPAMRSGTNQIRWIEAYDDHTLVFFHRESLATNVWNLNFSVIPKHVYENTVEDDPTLSNSEAHLALERSPITAGPYTLTKHIPNQEIVLTRRESWYLHQGKQVRPKPYLQTVRIRIVEDQAAALTELKSSDLDEMILNSEQWNRQTNGDDFYRRNTKVTATEWTTFSIFWNLKSPFFQDRKVRTVMAYALNHEKMLAETLQGLYQPAIGPFHRTSWMAPQELPTPYRQDLEKAAKLLDEAGWKDSDGDRIRDKQIAGRTIPFEFELICPPIEERLAVCRLLKQNLTELGIVCHVQPIEMPQLLSKLMNHRFHAGYGGWGSGTDPDTSENLYSAAAIENGRNYGNYSNPQIDRLFKAGKHEFNREKRAEIYRKIHQILWEDQPYLWLYDRNAFHAFSKELRGYHFSPRGPFHYDPGFFSLWKAAD